MSKAHLLLTAALTFVFHSFAIAAIPTNGTTGPGADDGLITLVYDPASGNLSLDAAGKELTALEVKSVGANFSNHAGSHPLMLNGLFDIYTPAKLFVLKPAPNQFGDTNFGNILPTGMTKDQIGADLTASGALYPSGGLGTVDLMYVPEPSSLYLLAIGSMSLLRARRPRRVGSIKRQPA